MKVFCVLVSIFVMIIGKRLTNRWCNLLTFLGALHTITVFFASLQLFSYYDSNPAVYFIIALGLLSFTVAYYFAVGDRNFHYKKSNEQLDGSISESYQIKYPLFVVCVLIIIVFSLQRLITFLALFASGISLSTLREYYFNPELAGSALGNISFSKNASITYIYLPCLFLLMIIATISLFHDIIRKRKKLYITIIYLCVGVYCLTSGGGRNLIYTIGFMSLFCYLYFNRQDFSIIFNNVRSERRLNKKNRRRVLFFIAIVAVWVMIALSSLRSDSGSDRTFAETLYQYFCGYIPYTSHFYENLQQSDYTNGWMFISCITKPFSNLMQSFLHISFPDTYMRACRLLEQFSEHVRISPYMRTNAYVSAFYCFYTDFGYTSVVIESMIFGACCGVSDTKNRLKPDHRSLVFYLIWFYIILWSIIRWYFLSAHIMLAFYLALFMFRREHR